MVARRSLSGSIVLHVAVVAALIAGGPTTPGSTRMDPPLVQVLLDEHAPPPVVPQEPELPVVVEPVIPPCDAEELTVPERPLEPEKRPELPRQVHEAKRSRALERGQARSRVVALRRSPVAVAARMDSTPPAVPDAPVVRVLSPVPGTNRPPAYPAVAKRRGWQGTVFVAIECDASGTVVHAVVARSSGHAVLDNAALAAVRSWLFTGGPGRVEQPIEFLLGS